jgi:hypothetical protein
MFETVAVESPVPRASSAWVDGPFDRRNSKSLSWFKCLSAPCDPGFVAPRTREPGVAVIAIRVQYPDVVVKL